MRTHIVVRGNILPKKKESEYYFKKKKSDAPAASDSLFLGSMFPHTPNLTHPLTGKRAVCARDTKQYPITNLMVKDRQGETCETKKKNERRNLCEQRGEERTSIHTGNKTFCF